MLIIFAWLNISLLVSIGFNSLFSIYILVAENRLTSSTDTADLSLYTDKSDLNSTSSSSSSLSTSHPELILFRAAENGDTGMKMMNNCK